MKTINCTYPENLVPGCYVDESAGSAEMLNRRIIETAQSAGYVIDPDPLTGETEMDKEDDDQDPEALQWEADFALDFLNACEKRDGFYWHVDENSLFLASGEDAE